MNSRLPRGSRGTEGCTGTGPRSPDQRLTEASARLLLRSRRLPSCADLSLVSDRADVLDHHDARPRAFRTPKLHTVAAVVPGSNNTARHPGRHAELRGITGVA